MCGFAGVVTDVAEQESSEQVLSEALEAISHRGPDSKGHMSWISSAGTCVQFGMRRLAVLDLSAAGQQPMTTPNGRYSLVFNGEITNFVEIRSRLERYGTAVRSTGDTEVLLRAWEAWGSDAISWLEGMFAFSILDREESTLTLCRDPFGIKPLFIGDLGNGSIAFGSEMASLLPFLRSRPKLDWSRAAQYLASGISDQSPGTFLEGISHLPPGALFTMHLNSGERKSSFRSWWPSVRTDPSMTMAHAAEGVRHLLTESVKRNLRSDVPVGVALSGGIDSTGIAYLVKEVAPDFPIRSFSFVATDPLLDESSWISMALKDLGGVGSTVKPARGDLLRDLDDVIISQGEPFVSTSIYAQYRVFRQMSELGIVVSLDGQGADEVFAGYQGYPGQRFRSLSETGQVLEAIGFLVNWTRWPERSWAKALARTGFELLPRTLADVLYRRIMTTRAMGMNKRRLRAQGIDWGARRNSAETEGLLGVRLKAELRASLLGGELQPLLRHGDRNSMRWSIESRVPYLDKELIALVLSMPERFLVDPSGTSKAVLRESLRGLIPESIRTRRDKIGFAAPESDWLTSSQDQLSRLILEGPPIGFLDSSKVAYAIENGKLPSPVVWRLVNLYRWATLLDVNCE